MAHSSTTADLFLVNMKKDFSGIGDNRDREQNKVKQNILLLQRKGIRLFKKHPLVRKSSLRDIGIGTWTIWYGKLINIKNMRNKPNNIRKLRITVILVFTIPKHFPLFLIGK